MFRYLAICTSLLLIANLGACSNQSGGPTGDDASTGATFQEDAGSQQASDDKIFVAQQSVDLERYSRMVSQNRVYVATAADKYQIAQLNPSQFTVEQSAALLAFYYQTDFQTLKYTVLSQKAVYELAYASPGDKLKKVDRGVGVMIRALENLRRAIVGNSLVLGIPISVPAKVAVENFESVRQTVSTSLIENRGQSRADYSADELKLIDMMALGIADSLIYQVKGRVYVLSVRLGAEGSPELTFTAIEQYAGLKPIVNNDAEMVRLQEALKTLYANAKEMEIKSYAAIAGATTIEAEHQAVLNFEYFALYTERLERLLDELGGRRGGKVEERLPSNSIESRIVNAKKNLESAEEKLAYLTENEPESIDDIAALEKEIESIRAEIEKLRAEQKEQQTKAGGNGQLRREEAEAEPLQIRSN